MLPVNLNSRQDKKRVGDRLCLVFCSYLGGESLPEPVSDNKYRGSNRHYLKTRTVFKRLVQDLDKNGLIRVKEIYWANDKGELLKQLIVDYLKNKNTFTTVKG